jgi:hypothetical protein
VRTSDSRLPGVRFAALPGIDVREAFEGDKLGKHQSAPRFCAFRTLVPSAGSLTHKQEASDELRLSPEYHEESKYELFLVEVTPPGRDIGGNSGGRGTSVGPPVRKLG